MFTIKECTQKERACRDCDGESCALCKRLKANVSSGDRIFVLNEDGAKAVGVLGLRGGAVIVKGVYGDMDSVYRDLMNRALLNVCRDFNPITVRVDCVDDYWRTFGFEQRNGGMEIMSSDIKFHR